MWRDSDHPEGGGSEKYIERVASRLAESGDDVTICCSHYPGAARDETRDGVRMRRRGGRLSVYLFGLAFLLGRDGRRADIVVDVQNGIPFFSPLVRRHGVVSLVHHVHREQWQIIYPGRAGKVGWWIESRLSPWLYRGCPYVTVSQASRSELVQLGVRPDDIEIVRNGIDVPHPTGLAPKATQPTLCVLGRLVPHKQPEHVLDVTAALRDSIPDLHVDVVGDGWWRETLERRVEELGLADHVTLHGHLSDEDRDTVLDRSWLLLVPSVKEGWGIVIMEAAARGVPALAYRSAGGVTEAILDGETGWLVDDLDGLAKRTEELLLDERMRQSMGDRARERAASFDWDATAQAFDDAIS